MITITQTIIHDYDNSLYTANIMYNYNVNIISIGLL